MGMTTFIWLGTLETLALERIISLCSADSKLDWQALPKVFHGVIWMGVHKRRFADVLKELRLLIDRTLRSRFLSATRLTVTGALIKKYGVCDDDEYHFVDDIGCWNDEDAYYEYAYGGG